MNGVPTAGSAKESTSRPPLRFELPTLGGERTLNLRSFLDGSRGAAIVFWSAVCSHCRRYDDYLLQLPERYPVSLAVIACRAGESRSDLEVAVRERQLSFPLLLDSGDVAGAWGVRQTPTAFLIDPGGDALYRGAIDDFSYPGSEGHTAYLDRAIAAFLAGQPIELESTPAFGCPVDSVYYRWPKVIGAIGSDLGGSGLGGSNDPPSGWKEDSTGGPKKK